MKQYLPFLGLVLLVSQACAQSNLTIGFEEKLYCAVEGGSFQFCLIALDGSLSSAGSVTVERSYLQGSATGTNIIEIPADFGVESEPLCVEEVSVDNDCLDSGNIIFLEIDEDSLPMSGDFVSVAEGCESAEVEVFDDEVIKYDFSTPVFYATEGDEEVQVCVNATWINGPTKRAVPLLFFTEQEDDVVDQQKKIVLIPKGTEDGDMICCDIEINEDLDVPDNETVEFLVHVNSEDVNVIAPLIQYAIVRVHPVPGNGCIPMFENGTPSVVGTVLGVDISDCVMAAQCMVSIPGSPSVDCSGDLSVLSLSRNGRRTITVTVTSPVSATLTREVRRDDNNCDVHLLNEGITIDGMDATVMFQGTGPNAGSEQPTFTCSVDGGPAQSCSSPWVFTPGDISSFQVAIRPDDQVVGCSRALTRTVSYPLMELV